MAGLILLVMMLTPLTVFGSTMVIVENASFESPETTFVNINVSDWQKADRPAYFPEDGMGGIFWPQTAGVFLDNNPYTNIGGAQAAYLLPLPQVSLSQQLDATYQVGQAYRLQVGVFGKSMPAESTATLSLSLYYTGEAGDVTVGTPTLIGFDSSTFPGGGPLSLVDFSVNLPVVQPGDDWAGENIGIRIESLMGDGQGSWDVDNVRLSAIPEPGAGLLLLCGLLTALCRKRRRHPHLQPL